MHFEKRKFSNFACRCRWCTECRVAEAWFMFAFHRFLETRVARKGPSWCNFPQHWKTFACTSHRTQADNLQVASNQIFTNFAISAKKKFWSRSVAVLMKTKRKIEEFENEKMKSDRGKTDEMTAMNYQNHRPIGALEPTTAKYLLEFLYFTREDEQFRFYKKVSKKQHASRVVESGWDEVHNGNRHLRNVRWARSSQTSSEFCFFSSSRAHLVSCLKSKEILSLDSTSQNWWAQVHGWWLMDWWSQPEEPKETCWKA